MVVRIPRKDLIVVESRVLDPHVVREPTRVVVEETPAESLRLAVDHTEDFKFLALTEPHERHEWKHYVQISDLAQPVLAVDLRQRLSTIRADDEDGGPTRRL
ncbi:MAG TPA: hypothetical protein VF647_13805 [Longimicrobium sp.]